MKRITSRTFVLLSLVVLGVTTACPSVSYAATATVVADGTDYSGRILVVTDSRPGQVFQCGQNLSEFDVVAINPGGGGAFRTKIGMLDSGPGERFAVNSQTDCGDGSAHLTLTEFTRGRLSLAEGVVSGDVTVEQDNVLVIVDVVDSVTDESGTYSIVNALVIGSGKPELISVGVCSDESVQPGDRFDVWLADAEGLLLVKS